MLNRIFLTILLINISGCAQHAGLPDTYIAFSPGAIITMHPPTEDGCQKIVTRASEITFCPLAEMEVEDK